MSATLSVIGCASRVAVTTSGASAVCSAARAVDIPAPEDITSATATAVP